MKKLFELGNQYVKESDWKDLALIKCCLCSMGIIIGTQVAPKHRKNIVCFTKGEHNRWNRHAANGAI